MLSFAEEIYLLALDDVTGKIVSYSDEFSLSYSLVGSSLCELSFIGKIETDIGNLILVDKTATGNKILDFFLSIMVKEERVMPISYWLKLLLSRANEIEELVLSELINKGILKRVDERTFWVFHTRRYPLINNKEIVSVEARIKSLLLNEKEIPEPRESVLVSLIHASGLLEAILSPRELKRTEKRIQDLVKVDILGREVSEMIREIKNFTPNVFCNAPI